MSSQNSSFPPFLKFGQFKSKDENTPDELELQVLETETFETEYSVNAKVLQKEGKQWNEKVLPIHSFASRNKQLLQQWNKAVRSGAIKVGKKFKLKTWLGISKNNNPIRRFEMVL